MLVLTCESFYSLLICKLDLAYKYDSRHFYLERDLKLNILNPFSKRTRLQLHLDIEKTFKLSSEILSKVIPFKSFLFFIYKPF